jgi:predicted nucleotide-binding protein with TIR-like domain
MAEHNRTPRLFVGSSTEGLELARAVSRNLDRDAHVTVWDKVFKANYSNLQNLLRCVHKSDFAVFVWSPDDTSMIRGTRLEAVRDNLVFEFGLFLGNLGRDRVFTIIPRDRKSLRIISDLNGITSLEYNADRIKGAGHELDEYDSAFSPAADAVRASILKAGAKTQAEEHTVDTILDRIRVLIDRSTTTRYVGKFPTFYDEIVQCVSKATESVKIACDFIGYGYFSAHQVWEHYLAALEERRRRGAKVQVVVLNSTWRHAQLEAQFAHNERAWNRLRADPEFNRLLTAYATRRGRQITTREEFVAVQATQDLEDMQKYGSAIASELTEKRSRMPVFLWIADAKEAVFSIPTYDAGVSEYGFYTRDLELVAALTRIWFAYNSDEAGGGDPERLPMGLVRQVPSKGRPLNKGSRVRTNSSPSKRSR